MERNEFLYKVGKKIHNIRKQNNLTQSDFNINQTQFGKYEQGKMNMSILVLKEICEKLQISADYLLDLPNEFNQLSSEKKVNYLMIKKLNKEENLKLTGMILAMLEQQKDHE